MPRRDVHKLDEAEREELLEGLRRLKAERRNGLSVYDEFVVQHADAAAKTSFDVSAQAVFPTDRGLIYHGPGSLPWNREFLRRFESELRRVLKSDRFDLPYWDWSTRDDSDLPSWPEGVLGGNGVANDGYGLRTPPFAIGPEGDRTWETVDANGEPSGLLKRRLGGRRGGPEKKLPTGAAFQEAMLEQEYDTAPYNRCSQDGIRTKLEQLLFQVHDWVGGTMLTSTAPNDPAFYLIHCNIDRLWHTWQREHPDTRYLQDDAGPKWHRLHDWIYPWLRERRIADVVLPVEGRYEG